MFEISVKTSISAAHRLENYNGPCSNLHGHNWGVQAVWRTKKQDAIGMSFDFKELKETLRQALAGFEHAYLNKALDKPTSENLTKLIYRRLKKMRYGDYLSSTKVEETEGCKVAYCEEGDENENKNK